MKNYFWYNTKLGYITIKEEENFITDIICGKIESSDNYSESSSIKKAYQQIDEYLNNKRKKLDFDIKINGTNFQIKVWKELMNIPYGETRSYQDIAIAVGDTKASRAVGMANNKNRLPIIIPCHRVIGKNGKLVGFNGGLNIKEILLEIEQNN